MCNRVHSALSFRRYCLCAILCASSFFGLFIDSAFSQRPRQAMRAALELPGAVVGALREPGAAASNNRAFIEEGAYFSPLVAAPSEHKLTERYDVGIRNVSWRSRDAKSYSALIFHPASRPIGDVKFSVVIFSHGLGSSAESFSYLARAWAERGSVVVMLRHPGSDESVWRGKLRPMAELKDAYHRSWSARDRARAIIAALDLVTSWHNEGTGLGADIDVSRIATSGSDLGALAALLVAGQLPPDNGPSLKDPRVSAVLAISPPVFCTSEQGAIVYSQITVPLMVITGTNDDGIVGTTKAYQRRIPYDSVRIDDRYLVVLQGADHRVYGGLRLSSQRQASDEPYHETIGIESSDFFSAYLRDDLFRLESLRAYGYLVPFANAVVERSLGARSRAPQFTASIEDCAVE